MYRHRVEWSTVTARKDYTCLACGEHINRGDKHWSKPKHIKDLSEAIKESLGSPIALGYYADCITLRACSGECMYNIENNKVPNMDDKLRDLVKLTLKNSLYNRLIVGRIEKYKRNR